MNIPKIQRNTYRVTLPILEKDVLIRPYTIEEEKAIITLQEETDKDPDQLIRAFFELTKNCIIEPNDLNLDEISMVDFSYLLIHIRGRSVSDAIQLIVPCTNSECKKKFEHSASFDKGLKIINKGVHKVSLPLDDNLTLEFSIPKSNFLFALKKEMKETDMLKEFVAYATTMVMYNGEIYKSFTPEQIKENITTSLYRKDFEKIAKEMSKLTQVIFEVETKCPHCGTSVVKREDNVMNFLA